MTGGRLPLRYTRVPMPPRLARSWTSPRRAALAALLAFVAGAGSPAAWAETLADLRKKVDELNKRVQGWISLAERDTREDEVDAYARYTEDDFKLKKGRVTAARIVAIMAAADANKELRLRAASVLSRATTLNPDPDLAAVKKGSRTPRRDFAVKNLLELLDDEKKGDRTARAYTNDILKAWFGGDLDAGQRAAVDAFSADVEKTWKAASRAWKEAIGRG